MIVLIDPNVVVDLYVDTGRYMYNEISIVVLVLLYDKSQFVLTESYHTNRVVM